MSLSIIKNEPSPDDSFSGLQQEIEALEGEVQAVKSNLAAFEAQIQERLGKEMRQLQELHERYKRHKQEKKAKRLEQKKRGKNWVEPTQLQKSVKNDKEGAVSGSAAQAELKRLYKEAMVQVHPDKIAHAGEADRLARAHALTVQLNGIYQRGDLEELILFYHQLMFADANNPAFATEVKLPDPKLRLEGLKKKKAALLQQLEQLKSAYTYQVLTTYENPLSFIEELHQYFLERIRVMEKRTRKL
ncbi:hypothetical protein [Cesiribacter sp. SM1]|uniref:hypothetical protein n=1 Tax=Cesiribacter sp. SM1 TaxID=2861196 RepID=UPI001CD76EC5|nr:hypothetical protein [Cesiribacter sp. SM1]